MRYEFKTHYSWNPGIAYLVGLIASDGCLLKDGRHIDITSKDIEIINNFQCILNKTRKIKTKLGQFKTPAYYLFFSDVALYDFLLKVGLTPNKSKTINELKIPEELFSDYLRGYFDGAGTVYGYWDPRWKSSFMYYCGFVSASLPYLQWLSSKITQHANTTAGRIKQNNRAYTLLYAKADSKKIFQFIYNEAGMASNLCLPRKMEKFHRFVHTTSYDKISTDARVL